MFSFQKKQIFTFLLTALIVMPVVFLAPLPFGGSEAHAGFLDDILKGVGGLTLSALMAPVLAITYVLFILVPKLLFSLAGIVFDVLVAFSLNSTVIQNQDFVNQGWIIMRDLSNTFFIFILLYIAISTILQTAGGQTKRLLATLVMVALFMNFSLYITKFVIDVGNVFALEFYANIGTDGPALIDFGAGAVQPKRIALTFLSTFDLEQMSGLTVLGALNEPGKAMFFMVMLAIMYLVATFVFLSAGFLFLGRVVAFWFLMILGPLAFMSMILPYTRGKVWGRWSSELVSQSFFAPIFLFFLYLTLILAQTSGNLFQVGTATGDPATVGIVQFFVTFLNFFALITVLLFGLKTAKSMSGEMGASMLKIGGAATGAAVGGAAWAGRNTVGRYAEHLSKTKGDEWKQSRMGQLYLSGTNAVANSSFDVRSSKTVQNVQGQVGGINLGAAGGAGGYTKTAAEKNAANKRTGDTMKSNPEAHAKYIASLEKVDVTTNINGAKRGLRGNPDAEAMAYWSTLSTRERQEAKAAATGKNKDYLNSLDTKLTSGFKEKQMKTEEKGMRQFGKERAQETLEEYEALGTPSERLAYLQKSLSPDADEAKAQRVALLKNSTAAQRAEIENYEKDAKVADDKKFFAGIDRSAELSREEQSKILEQDKKYGDLNRENIAKNAQKGRVDKLSSLVNDYSAKRRTDLAALQAEAAAHIKDMNDNEVAALEATYLTSEVVAPHITSGVIAKVEKGDKVKLTVGEKEEFYKNLNEHASPETKEYLENRNSAEPKNRARGKFQGTGGAQPKNK